MKLSLTTITAFVLTASCAPTSKTTGDWNDPKECKPYTFTSTYQVYATPDQVVNATNALTGGLAGAEGWYFYAINSKKDVICYDITLKGFRGEYQSPAKTATHIHQAAKGQNGPPRIAFPNPTDIGKGLRNSKGCITGPFTTGVLANGNDTGAGFKVEAIEKDPASFFTDVHSSLAVPGAVRGQLAPKKADACQ
ncbi:hypothetical protein N0V82_003911 [Gnomoniopsis sp. IMI 355080]|nr:hypothetical protein N0V82_003911 [Gnomoniopsis sp. IMI 355080]